MDHRPDNGKSMKIASSFNDTILHHDNDSHAGLDTTGVKRDRSDHIRDALQRRFVTKSEYRDLLTDNNSTSRADTDLGQVQLDIDVLPIFESNTTKRRQVSFSALQEWEGYVLTVDKETFTARLVDLTQQGTIEEEADFPLEDVSDDEQKLVEPGAVFRWSIGYQRSLGGNKRRVSQIVFRRLPRWTRRELEDNRKRASELGALIREESV